LLGRTDQQHLLLQYALQLFELGHGVMANQQFEIRGCLPDLRQNHPEEEEEFERLRDELDSVSECLPARNGSASANPTTSVSSRCHAASLELDALIHKIRQRPNFERFLLPPTANDLMKLARCGKTIVVFNVSTVCDAFILQWNNIITVGLPELGLACSAGTKALIILPASTSGQLCRQRRRM
jgi:hypothetical protein